MKINIACGKEVFKVNINVDPEASLSSGYRFFDYNSWKDWTLNLVLRLQGHSVDLIPSAENDDNSSEESCTTLGELKTLVASKFNLDPNAMKMIHRGRSLLGDDDYSLTLFKFKENDKVMVLGKLSTFQEDLGWKRLLEYEKKYLMDMGKRYDRNSNDLNGLEQDFLEGQMRKDASKKLERCLRQFTEDCLKHLETIDAIQIVTENTGDEQAQRNREKRKYLINGVQELLNKNDKFINRLNDYVYKIEHPEEAL